MTTINNSGAEQGLYFAKTHHLPGEEGEYGVGERLPPSLSYPPSARKLLKVWFANDDAAIAYELGKLSDNGDYTGFEVCVWHYPIGSQQHETRTGCAPLDKATPAGGLELVFDGLVAVQARATRGSEVTLIDLDVDGT